MMSPTVVLSRRIPGLSERGLSNFVTSACRAAGLNGAPTVLVTNSVSADIAARNARALGHSVAEEVKILVLHGVLHLAGYDHESDSGQMAEKELRLRRKLGLPAALIERAAVKRRRPTNARSRT
jgi:ssRNA-specific RNase YbeY (16S rRNA maturation enzyme)